MQHGKWTLRYEYIRCGNPRCKSCPHGPYWYGYQHIRDRMRKCYFGKRNPAEPEPGGPAGEPSSRPEEPHPHDAINCRATATLALALEILGMPTGCRDLPAIRLAYLRLAKATRPDHGGDARRFGHVHTAWSYVAAAMGWTGR